MKIGLLAYHSACNFGATLQLLSTYMYLKNSHHEPIIINWIPYSLEKSYSQTVPPAQFNNQKTTRKELWNETALCRTAEDISKVIVDEAIEAVIIGSDAVAQHHPLLERIVFPCRKIVGIKKNTEDMEFPNPFWAIWIEMLQKPIPVAVMSVSSQDSAYRLIPVSTRRKMLQCIRRYSYLSVRDEWTQAMFSFLTKGQYTPEITPDPVFAFNQNAGSLISTQEDTLQKFHLPERYILISFLNTRPPSVTQDWINEFVQLASSKGYTCANLPFSSNYGFGNVQTSIELPLSPIDWYALIKYSHGYVGNNMHPIIVSLHNQVPFFCFDNYGTSHLNGLLTSDKSSKIKHILTQARLNNCRVSSLSRYSKAPSPHVVYSALRDFDTTKSKNFAAERLVAYNDMMKDILKAII